MFEVIDSPLIYLAQEAERRRLARELHDGVVRSLTALVTDLEYFRTRRTATFEDVGQDIAAKLELWQALARESLASMRQTLGIESAPGRGTRVDVELPCPRRREDDVAEYMIQLANTSTASVAQQQSARGQAHDGLTAREMETVVLLAKGKKAKEVARVLGVSEKTVRNHIGHIYHKLNVDDRSQVVLYAVRKGLVDVSEE